MLNLKLPFYGKEGTIKEIVEQEDRCIVVRHGTNGELLDSYLLNEETKKLIVEEYYQNLEEYLITNLPDYQMQKKVDNMNSKVAKTNLLLIIGSMSVIGLMIPTLGVITSKAVASISSLVSLVTFSAMLLTTVSYTIGEITKKKSLSFIQEYEQYQEQLTKHKQELLKEKTISPKLIGNIKPIQPIKDYNINSKPKIKTKEHE